MRAGMNKQRTELLVIVRKWPVAQPVAKFVGVAGIEQLLESAETIAEAHGTRVEGKEVQIMIAEHGNDGFAEFSHIPQLKGKRLLDRIAIDGAENVDLERGGLFIGGHLGNWEWMAPAVACSKRPSMRNWRMGDRMGPKYSISDVRQGLQERGGARV